MAPETTRVEIAWLAGLLEGEGCFTFQKHGGSNRRQVRVGLKMTDQDVVARARDIIRPKKAKLSTNRSRQKGHKDSYEFKLYGKEAEEVMRAVRPFMGERRGARIDELLSMEGLPHHDADPAGQHP